MVFAFLLYVVTDLWLGDCPYLNRHRDPVVWEMLTIKESIIVHERALTHIEEI